jgi:hypothetical protein
MATYDSHYKPKTIYHEVTANEVTSGSAAVTLFSPATGRVANSNVAHFLDVKDSSGIAKANGLMSTYSSGVVTVQNSATDLATGDIVLIMGMTYS